MEDPRSRRTCSQLDSINIANPDFATMHKSQLAGALMLIVGAFILILLASFVVSVIIVILQLLAVIIGIILVLGGIAMLLFGRRFWNRRSMGWERPATT